MATTERRVAAAVVAATRLAARLRGKIAEEDAVPSLVIGKLDGDQVLEQEVGAGRTAVREICRQGVIGFFRGVSEKHRQNKSMRKKNFFFIRTANRLRIHQLVQPPQPTVSHERRRIRAIDILIEVGLGGGERFGAAGVDLRRAVTSERHPGFYVVVFLGEGRLVDQIGYILELAAKGGIVEDTIIHRVARDSEIGTWKNGKV